MKPRAVHPADAIKHYSDLIILEREKLDECLRNLTHFAEQLRRVTEETSQRLLTRD
jgi:hypothetical protein